MRDAGRHMNYSLGILGRKEGKAGLFVAWLWPRPILQPPNSRVNRQAHTCGKRQAVTVVGEILVDSGTVGKKKKKKKKKIYIMQVFFYIRLCCACPVAI